MPLLNRLQMLKQVLHTTWLYKQAIEVNLVRKEMFTNIQFLHTGACCTTLTSRSFKG